MATKSRPKVPDAKVLIVDDQPIVRHGLAQVLADQPGFTVCGQGAEPVEVFRLVAFHRPEVIVLGLSLKNGSGLDLIKRVKSHYPESKILVLSVRDELLFAERALRAGAAGYISKHEAPDRIVEGIRQVLSGKVCLSAQLTDRLLSRVANGTELDESPLQVLSDRELEVFELIGQGLTTGQISRKLHLSVKTIETYRENIKSKLNLRTGAELNRHALQWVLEYS